MRSWTLLRAFGPHGTPTIIYSLQILFLIFSSQGKGTPLIVASVKGHSDVVQLLLEAGTDVDVQFKVSIRVYCS